MWFTNYVLARFHGVEAAEVQSHGVILQGTATECHFTHDIAWHTKWFGHASCLISVISTMVLYDITYSGGTLPVERANSNT